MALTIELRSTGVDASFDAICVDNKQKCHSSIFSVVPTHRRARWRGEEALGRSARRTRRRRRPCTLSWRRRRKQRSTLSRRLSRRGACAFTWRPPTASLTWYAGACAWARGHECAAGVVRVTSLISQPLPACPLIVGFLLAVPPRGFLLRGRAGWGVRGQEAGGDDPRRVRGRHLRRGHVLPHAPRHDAGWLVCLFASSSHALTPMLYARERRKGWVGGERHKLSIHTYPIWSFLFARRVVLADRRWPTSRCWCGRLLFVELGVPAAAAAARGPFGIPRRDHLLARAFARDHEEMVR